MNIDEQMFGAGAPSWAERWVLAKLYDLGKFCFGVGTATIAFLFTAQKMTPSGTWEPGLKHGFVLLVIALAVSIGMVIAAAPYLKDKVTRSLVSSQIVIALVVLGWFLLWGIGTWQGVSAVLSP
jgi:hypothetical protein